MTVICLFQIDDFVDVNEGEKAIFKLWNNHLDKHPAFGDLHIKIVLMDFVQKCGPVIHQNNLYRNFVLHVYNLAEFGLLTTFEVYDVIIRMQEVSAEIENDVGTQNSAEAGKNNVARSSKAESSKKVTQEGENDNRQTSKRAGEFDSGHREAPKKTKSSQDKLSTVKVIDVDEEDTIDSDSDVNFTLRLSDTEDEDVRAVDVTRKTMTQQQHVLSINNNVGGIRFRPTVTPMNSFDFGDSSR